jgi:hypothetical protein
VQVSISNGFLSILKDTTLSTAYLQLDTLSYNTTYYWRVRATNPVGTGAYSSSWFTVTPLLSKSPPATVTTLAAYGTDTNNVKLRWTTVGNDSVTGRADHYDLRYSVSNITTANWSSAIQISGEPTPRLAGLLDSMTVTGLAHGTQYYFGLKVYDDTTGVSGLSNIATARTDTTATGPTGPGYPNAVTTLAVDSTSAINLYLSWTAVGDDGNVGTATTYDIRYSTRKPSTGELVTNGGFNSDINGWQLVNAGGTLSWDASHGRVSGGALKLVNSSSYSGVVYPISNTDADSATVSMYVYPTYRDTIDLYVLDQNNGLIGVSQQKFLQPGMWNLVSRTVKLSGLQTQIRPGFNFDAGQSNNVIWIDDASCTVGIPWASLSLCYGETAPQVSGTLEHYTLTGLSNNTLYYAAMKVIDDSANTSGLSNVVSGTTRTIPDTTTVTDSTDTDTLKVYSGKYYVRSGGNDASAGTSYATAWQTLIHANSTPVAGDTIVIYSGSYTGNLTPTHSGTSTKRIVYSAYGSDVVTVTGDANANDGNSMSLAMDYISVERIRFVDAARASTDPAWYWGTISGDHNTLNKVQFLDDQDTTQYFSHGKKGRLIYVSGNFTTIRRSKLTGGYHGIVIDGPAPRYYNFDRDTVYRSGYCNIILGGGGAVAGVYHAGLVQNCVLDTCGEDNIQLQNNGTPTTLANSGIIIRNNKMKNARENCIDVKATGPTVCIEDNDLVLSVGNDTNEDNGGVNNDNGGSGIELGAGDYSEHVMTRFNRIVMNHSGSKIYGGGHFYNNTVGANNNSYRGFPDTSIAFYGATTDGLGESGYKRVINNIFFQHSTSTKGGEVMMKKAGGSDFEINNNIYWKFGSLARIGTNVKGFATEVWAVGLTAWYSTISGTDFDGWTGKDAASLESDPQFVNVPDTIKGWSDTLNFNIGVSSPAKAAGKALTTTTNTGTNSTSLTVDDPYFFRTDYGIPSFYSGVKGDSIQIGTQAAVEISAIDYSTSTLTLSSQRTWSNGASVWLWKDGRKVDDIGSKQRD